jgi:hypothetical protein
MTMASDEMPERVWLWRDGQTLFAIYGEVGGATEYVRADTRPTPDLTARLVEALHRNTKELEDINHSHATDFQKVRELIVENRSVLSALAKEQGL